ncbi:MucR family transcriptional regulator [Methylorubrum populi]|uniref:MucR family transcriptional regulator n=1 Tax=Methylorubrum populi TaxID=223967 RepID=A0A160PDP4_9HYPH|nr:MucR family transcriptional regulator [Methylorubrum populi]BAU91179.1 MucR family transcriptional regulator [Methylorubrum populi]
MSNDTSEATYAQAELAAEIVMAYVSNNVLPAKDLPTLIGEVHAALAGLGGTVAPAAAEPKVEKPTAAAIKKSITPDALISFIDGKPYKTLKRHLGMHGLDAYSYRARYGLPSDYPMTAPSYSERRSALAKDLGLGRLGGRARKQAAE